MILIVFLLFLFANYCFSFNIDTNNPVIYENPFKELNDSGYFGYSVVLYPGNRSRKPWILIGAPKEYNLKKERSGVCFKCGVAEPCEIFDVDGLSMHLTTEKIDTAWIGASMDINYVSNRMVTCAPRWINKKTSGGKVNDYYMQGACYWFHTGDNSTQKITPLNDPNRAIFTHPQGGSVYNFAQGQAGFSVHMPLKEKEIILGAPGVYNWDGTSILYKDTPDTTPIASRLRNQNRRARYADPNEFSFKNIANAIETKETAAYDLLGYATTSGYFFTRTQLLYVSSAPRSYYKGQVIIYEFEKTLEARLAVIDRMSGQQFGEYFGASVTAGDLNKDGLDDLIVGAPFHTSKKYNEGKVYIFLGHKSRHLQVPKLDSIVGKSANAQFGTTVQYLGDLDHDGFGDLAVAAPYEEEKSGVIYLFKGSKYGLDTAYSQRIVGKDIYPNLRGFGMSISRPADMDFNGYPEIAVGAYLSEHVVFLRSHPVIKIYQELISYDLQLDFKQKRFQIGMCFFYSLDQMYPNQISINRSLILDSQLGRAYLKSNEYTKTINLHPDQRYCENVTINLENSFSNRYNPITIDLFHTFNKPQEKNEIVYINGSKTGNDIFCPRCPVYDKYNSIYSSTLEIPFSLGCKSEKICKASLEINPKIIGLSESNVFVLGSKDYIRLQVDIKNFGERAYLTQMFVTVPEIVTFRSTPPACTEKNSSSVSCSVDNPLESNGQNSVFLDLDMTRVGSGKDNSLAFTLEVTTSSENDRDRIKKVTLQLKRESDVTITGKSQEQSYSFRNITQGKPNFTQIYQIETFGSSSLNEIVVEINIPHILKIDGKSNIYFTYLYPFLDQEVRCISNFTYLAEEKQTPDSTDLEFIQDDNSEGNESLKRTVRQVEVFNKSMTTKARLTKENEFFQNRTYYINCSMDQVICSKISCSVGPIKAGQVIKIRLKMMLDVTAINDFLSKKDVVLFATQGNVKVTNPKGFIQSGDRPDSVEVASLFITESQTEDIALWIIIISAIAGLLLLLILTVVLFKAGFFKRTTKEELEQLKKEMEYNEIDNLDEKEDDQ